MKRSYKRWNNFTSDEMKRFLQAMKRFHKRWNDFTSDETILQVMKRFYKWWDETILQAMGLFYKLWNDFTSDTRPCTRHLHLTDIVGDWHFGGLAVCALEKCLPSIRTLSMTCCCSNVLIVVTCKIESTQTNPISWIFNTTIPLILFWHICSIENNVNDKSPFWKNVKLKSPSFELQTASPGPVIMYVLTLCNRKGLRIDCICTRLHRRHRAWATSWNLATVRWRLSRLAQSTIVI